MREGNFQILEAIFLTSSTELSSAKKVPGHALTHLHVDNVENLKAIFTKTFYSVSRQLFVSRYLNPIYI